MNKYYHITAVLDSGLSISVTNAQATSREDAYLNFINRNRRDIENIVSITIIKRVDQEC